MYIYIYGDKRHNQQASIFICDEDITWYSKNCIQKTHFYKKKNLQERIPTTLLCYAVRHVMYSYDQSIIIHDFSNTIFCIDDFQQFLSRKILIEQIDYNILTRKQ